MPWTVKGGVLNNNISIAGVDLRLEERASGSLLDQDTTGADGKYTMGTTFVGLVTLFMDKGGPHEDFRDLDSDGSSTESTDLGKPPPNINPTLVDPGNEIFIKNTGVHTDLVIADDADGDGLAINQVKVSGPAWFTVSIEDGSVPGSYKRRFDTDAAGPGNYSASMRAEDDWAGVGTTKQFTIEIEPVNSPPVINDPGDKDYFNNIGTQDFSLFASDVDGGPLTFALAAGPAWISVTSGGLVSVDTDEATKAVHGVTFRVTDDEGAFDQVSITITIKNNPPDLVNPVTITFVSGGGIATKQLIATDIDTEDTLTFSKISGQSFITVPSNGLLTVNTNASRDNVTENFEGVGLPPFTGEDVAVMTQVTGTATIDYDFDRTMVTGAPSSWDDESVQCEVPANSNISSIRILLDTDQDNVYFKTHFIGETGPGTAGQYRDIIIFDHTNGGSAVFFRWQLVSGVLNWRVHHKKADSSFMLDYNQPMSLDTEYKVEIEFIKGTSITVWLNDLLIVQNFDVINDSIEFIQCGLCNGTSNNNIKILHFDNIEFSSPTPFDNTYSVTADVNDGDGGSEQETFNVVLTTPDPASEVHLVT